MGRRKVISDERLLELARAAFVEKGLMASTRRIARQAGVSEAVLFQRYKTKAELFLAAMVPPAFDFKSCMPEAGSEEGGERILRDLTFGLLNYFRAATPVVVQLLARQDFEFEKFAQAHPDNPLVTMRCSLMEFLARLKVEGKLGAEPAPVALVLFMMANSVALFERFGAHGGQFSDAMVELAVASVWRGFRGAGLKEFEGV